MNTELPDVYNARYFGLISDHSRSSAEAVVPRVIDLLRPRSVIDVGCGVGEWAAAFKRHGVEDVLGVDGGQVEDQLKLSTSEFHRADLTEPLLLDRKFDLAISLEVAEHLPATVADNFVASLTGLAPAVFFSAAAPDQGGERHINEQWPGFWAEKFLTHGFHPFDCLRLSFWNHPGVQWWYAQNMILFAAEPVRSHLRKSVPEAHDLPSLVHPANLGRHLWRERALAMCVDLASIIPSGKCLVLADAGRLGEIYLPGRTLASFMEKDGLYFGPPTDDDSAIEELKSRFSQGFEYVAFAWPAFWKLNYYKGMHRYLQSSGRVALQNENVVLFALECN